MSYKKILCHCSFSLIMIMFLSSMSQARVYLDITSPDFRKVPFAVPYFTDKNEPDTVEKSDRDLAELLSNALEFHGFISVVSPDRYDGSKNTDWLDLGVDFVIITDYQVSGDIISFEFRLLDISEEKIPVNFENSKLMEIKVNN